MVGAIYRFTVGVFRCTAIDDDAGGNRNVLLIETDQQKLLIDTGTGDSTQPPGQLLACLAELEVAPSAIDCVIISHADYDHGAGLVDIAGNRIFPNARIVMSPREWSFWALRKQRFPRMADLIAAVGNETAELADRVPYERLPNLREYVEFVEPEDEVVAGIRLLAAPGHTPGMVTVVLESQGQLCFFIADIYYGWSNEQQAPGAPKIIGDPAFHAVADLDPAQALISRDQIFTRAIAANALLMATHVPFPGLGHVIHHGDQWAWVPLRT
jgi:glyoxylase-like metal-dependent hydrolase (beta-lactamase superfamily II)